MASYFPKHLFGVVKSLTCFAGGVMAAYAMAPDHYWMLMFAGMSAFYIVFVSTKTATMSAIYGFFFGLGYFLKGLWWIGNALLVEGNDYGWVWPLAVMGLPTLLALFTATATGLSKRFFKDDLAIFLGFVAFLSLSEWLRGHIFTGFPWNLYGYAWVNNEPLLQTAALIGPYGLTFLTIFWASMPAFVLTSKHVHHHISVLLIASISLLGCFYYGTYRLQSNPTQYHEGVNVHVVQPNIAQEDKWEPKKVSDHLRKHVKLSQPDVAPEDTTFIIWPETALHPIFYAEKTLLEKILASYPENTYLLAGALRQENQTFSNSLAAFNRQGHEVALYDKSHLVPFGEYIPFQKFIPLQTITQFNGFIAGDGPQTMQIGNAPAFSPLICYEIIFPGEVVGTARPDWIVNVTNDAWYGNSAGPYQHFAQGRMRAVEQGIPVVRSANTGISGVVDAYGRVIALRKLSTASFITTPLPQKASSPTLYTQFQDSFYFGFVLFFFAIAIFLSRKKQTI